MAHIARVCNYWLGGKDHFAADRVAGEATIAVYPGIRLAGPGRASHLRIGCDHSGHLLITTDPFHARFVRFIPT